MDIITIVIILFILLESLNVLLLYFFPSSSKGNAMGAFKAYEKSKENPEVHMLVKYLINWVAGTKIIFIALLLVILIFGDSNLQFYSMIALIITTATFFWRLYPLIKKMDDSNNITPKGYSKTLAMMITSFIVVFAAAVLYALFG